MAISTQIQNLNLIPGKSAPVVVHLSQGNVGDTVKFYMYDGSNEYRPSNVSITVHGTRRDNVSFGPYEVSYSSGSNLVSFGVTSSMTAVSGGAIAELTIVDENEHTVGTANFAILVEDGVFPNGPTYEDDTSVYQNILSYVQHYSSLVEKMRNEYVTPQMFGAAADGVTDDSSAINEAIASGKMVFFPHGDYLINSPINIHNQFSNVIDASSANIIYNGTEYAVDINYVDNCTIAINRITATNGSGILIHSSSPEDHVQYDVIDVRTIFAKNNCITVNPSETGWVNEIKYYNLHCASGDVGVYIKNDCNVNTCNQHLFYGISPEGVSTLFKLDGTKQTVSDVFVSGCRAHESHTYLYETLGTVANVRHVMNQPMVDTWLNLSGTCINWVFDCPYTDSVNHIAYKGAYTLTGTSVIPFEKEFMTYAAISPIPSNSDANNLKNGTYWISFASLSGITNLPSGFNKAGTLTVTSGAGGNSRDYLRQVLKAYDSDLTYERTSNGNSGSSWRPWVKIVKMSDYTDITLPVTLNANSLYSYTFPNSKTAYDVQLLYSYQVQLYDLRAYLSSDGKGLTIKGGTNAASQSDVPNVVARVWYSD